VETQEWA